MARYDAAIGSSSPWSPDEGFVASRDAGINPTALSLADIQQAINTVIEHDACARTQPRGSIETAIRDLFDAETEAVQAVHDNHGVVPGPHIDRDTLLTAGFTATEADDLIHGDHYPVTTMPPACRQDNYGSTRDNLLRYIVEITRLLRKGKLLPVKRHPHLAAPTGFIITQNGAKVRLVCDQTAIGLNGAEMVPYFSLPGIQDCLSLGHANDQVLKEDVTDMFLGLRLHPDQYTLCGIVNELTGQIYVYPFLLFGNSASPALAGKVMSAVQRVARPRLDAAGLLSHNEDVDQLPHEHRPQVLSRWEELSHNAKDAIVDLVNTRIRSRNLDAFVCYVDDCAWVSRGDDAIRASAIIRDTLNMVGLDFKESKREGPSDRLVFIGVGLDLENLELYLDDAKRESILNDVENLWRCRGKPVPLDKLRSVVGRISWASVAYSAGYAYIRRLWDAIAAVPLNHQRRRSKYHLNPTAEFWSDIAWWRNAMQHPARRRICEQFGTGRLGLWSGSPLEADVIAATDASDVAWGYVTYPRGFIPIDALTNVTAEDLDNGVTGSATSGQLGLQLPPRHSKSAMTNSVIDTEVGSQYRSSRDRKAVEDARHRVCDATLVELKGERHRGSYQGAAMAMSINWKELRTVVTLCRRHAEEWRGLRVLVRVDNQTAVSYINKGYGRATHLTRLGRQIKTMQARHNFELRAQYVNTKANTVPDGCSRLTIDSSCLNSSLTDELHTQIEHELGPFDIDMQCDLVGTNEAMAVDITGLHTLWQPPRDRAKEVLVHIINARARTASPPNDVTDTSAVVVLPDFVFSSMPASIRNRFEVVRRFPKGSSMLSEWHTDDTDATLDSTLESMPETHYTEATASAVSGQRRRRIVGSATWASVAVRTCPR